MATQTKSRAAKPKAPTLADRYHAEGCPVLAGTSDRTSPIESYLEDRPAGEERPAATLRITRCVECGGHVVEPAGEKEGNSDGE